MSGSKSIITRQQFLGLHKPTAKLLECLNSKLQFVNIHCVYRAVYDKLTNYGNDS